MASQPVLQRIIKSATLRWAAVSYLISVLIAGLIFIFEFGEEKDWRTEIALIRSMKTVEEMKMKSRRFDERINNLDEKFNSIIDLKKLDPNHLKKVLKSIKEFETQSDDQISPLVAKITKLDQEGKRLSEEFKQIRSALYPTEPDKILMVARLGDEFRLVNYKMRALNNNIKELQSNVNEKVQSNYEYIGREFEQFYWLLGTLGALILPVVGRLIYDLLIARRRDSEHGLGNTVVPEQSSPPTTSQKS